MTTTPTRAAELVARASYGRLVASLAARARDISAAEDALAEAFLAALTRWPVDGVPENPDAWLLTAARRRLLDDHRRTVVRSREAEAVAAMLEETANGNGAPLLDDRVSLLLVCTHPAIDPDAQVPLMLQTVLGLDAVAIASAMRIAPKTMGQRLWRAKAKIREARIPFELPDPTALPARLEAVLEAVYAAYGAAWDDARGVDARLRGLADEAIYIARTLVGLVPGEPETYGLLSLMLFAEARRPARRTADNRYVPLEQQDQRLWSQPQIAEAEQLLLRAFDLGRIGPFQLQAALQSAHVSGARRGVVDHRAILALYEGLVRMAPSLGALVGQAAALIEGASGDEALAALDAIDPAVASSYQPWWAVRAAALRAAGRRDDARRAYTRAVGMTEDDGTRQFLLACLSEL